MPWQSRYSAGVLLRCGGSSGLLSPDPVLAVVPRQTAVPMCAFLVTSVLAFIACDIFRFFNKGLTAFCTFLSYIVGVVSLLEYSEHSLFTVPSQHQSFCYSALFHLPPLE